MVSYYFASKRESFSLEGLLNEPTLKKSFFEGKQKITDIRFKTLDKGRVFTKESINIEFKKSQNKIIVSFPKSEGQFMNLFHTIGLYYEQDVKDKLSDGFVDENFEIKDKKGNKQNLEPPKIVWVENIKNFENEVILDHPSRIKTHRGYPESQEIKNDNREFLKKNFSQSDMESFWSYNQGTDFIILNKKNINLKKTIESFVQSLPSKLGQIIKYISMKKEFEDYQNLKLDKDTDYIQHLDLKEKVKIIEKYNKFLYHKFYDFNNSEDLRTSIQKEVMKKSFSSNEIGKVVIENLVPIFNETKHKNLLEYFKDPSLFDNFVNILKIPPKDITSYIFSFIHEKGIKNGSEYSYLKESKEFEDEFRSGLIDFLEENEEIGLKSEIDYEFENEQSVNLKKLNELWKDSSFEKLRKRMIKGRIYNFIEERKLFNNPFENQKFVGRNKEKFEKYILNLARKRPIYLENGHTLTYWLSKYPHLEKILTKQEKEDYLKDALKKISDSNYLLRRFLNQKKFKRTKSRIIRKFNFDFNEKTKFSKTEIIKNMQNYSFFVIPTFLSGFSNKQYKRFVQQLKEYHVPSKREEDFTLIYDSRISNIYRETIPEKLRKEFKINSSSRDKKAISQNFYEREDYFLNLNNYLNQLKTKKD